MTEKNEKTPAVLDDTLFLYLMKFNIVENYYLRALPLNTLVNDGEENPKLIAPLIIRDVPGIHQFVKQAVKFDEISSVNLRKRLVEDEQRDGAYLIRGRLISHKIYLHNFTNSALRNLRVKSVEELQQRFLPPDFIQGGHLVGTKTQNAIAAGLMGGKGYLIKQTAHGGLGVGKMSLFDAYGLAAEFSIAPRTGLQSKDYIDPVRRLAGILRTYGENKCEWKETVITPEQLRLNVTKYLSIPDRMFSAVLDLITRKEVAGV